MTWSVCCSLVSPFWGDEVRFDRCGKFWGEDLSLEIHHGRSREARRVLGLEPVFEQAHAEAAKKGLHAAALTPFLLDRVRALTGDRALHANIVLLENNARLAAQIALALNGQDRDLVLTRLLELLAIREMGESAG